MLQLNQFHFQKMFSVDLFDILVRDRHAELLSNIEREQVERYVVQIAQVEERAAEGWFAGL